MSTSALRSVGLLDVLSRVRSAEPSVAALDRHARSARASCAGTIDGVNMASMEESVTTSPFHGAFLLRRFTNSHRIGYAVSQAPNAIQPTICSAKSAGKAAQGIGNVRSDIAKNPAMRGRVAEGAFPHARPAASGGVVAARTIIFQRAARSPAAERWSSVSRAPRAGDR